MNQNRKEELLTRWMDDALTDEELRELGPVLAEEPELEREREAYRTMRSELQEAVPAEVEPPYPDFFNAHLERMVEDSMRGSSGRSARSGGMSRMWSWWLAPAATAALVVAFMAGMKLQPDNVPAPLAAESGASATALYSPMDNVRIEAVTDENLGFSTVILLTGLEDMPDEGLVGWQGTGDRLFVTTAADTY